MAAVHVSPYAGSWYPGRAEELDELIEGLFEGSRERTGAHLLPLGRAFVVPHAGLQYSGTVAAAAYRHIRELKPERIILLGFSHRGGPAAVAIPRVERIATPIGAVDVDRAAAAQLDGRTPFRMVAEPEVCDHSVEIQLPLLVKAAPGTPVLPLYVGHLDDERRDAAAAALSELCGPGTALVASSDLTHYGRSFGYQPFPVDAHTPQKLQSLDFGVMQASGSLDPGIFLEHLAETGATVCGYNPIALLLRTLCAGGGESFQTTLDYQTSGEITGDYHHSVSYGALGYFPAEAFELTNEEQKLLLASAARTLQHLFETGERRPMPPDTVPPALARQAGVFVSLHEGPHLRGCVGHRCGCEPLAEAVPELTLSAALDDPRFEPLKKPKHPVTIEISVLTPMRRVRDASGFRLGRHGAYLACGLYRSLLLPQVAGDREWSTETFLGALCRKAGLATHAWQNPETHLYIFRAQVFSSE